MKERMGIPEDINYFQFVNSPNKGVLFMYLLLVILEKGPPIVFSAGNALVDKTGELAKSTLASPVRK